MRHTRVSLLGALLALGLVLAVAPTSAAPTALLTSSLAVVSAPSQVNIQGSSAVLANYTNSPSVPSIVVGILVVQNSAGQTVGVFYATASVSSGQSYVPFYLVTYGISGHYTGRVFVVTQDWVPLSTESTVSLSV